MRLPRNGTPVANALWALCGAVMGITLTGWIVPGGNTRISGSPAPASGPEGKPPVRNAALQSRPGGRAWPAADVPASKLSDALARGEHFRKAGAEAARRDLAAALQQAYSIPNRQDQLDFYRGLYGVWSREDPVAALDNAQASFPAGQLQSDTIGIAMNQWAEENPREAWLWAEQNLAGPLKGRALTDLMIGWSRRAPEQAAEWLQSTGMTSQPLFNAIGATWAEDRPVAAADWAKSLPDGPARETAEVAVAGSWAAQDPEAAASHFAEEIASGEELNLVIAIADVWASTDPAATATWIGKMTDGPAKDEAAATLATLWAASDIRAAVAWSSSISSAETRREVVAHIGTTWGAIEPAAALDWLGTLPAGEASEGISGALYSWAGTDPAGMREWLVASPASPFGDQARQSLGDVLSETNLPDTMDLALGMTSEKARNEALSRYFREWRKQDDEGARDWLQTHWDSLPDGSRSQLAAEQSRTVVPR
jgi:hypothetical protein